MFRLRAVSNSDDTTASMNNYSSIGSVQEYFVSLCIMKMNRSVGDICESRN